MEFEVCIDYQRAESLKEPNEDGGLETRPHPDFANYSTTVDGFHRRPKPLFENFNDSVLRMEKNDSSTFLPENRVSIQDFVSVDYDEDLIEKLNEVDNNLRRKGYNAAWSVIGGFRGEDLDEVLSETEESIEIGFSIEREDNDIYVGGRCGQNEIKFSPRIERVGKPEAFTWSYTDEIYSDVCDALDDANILQDSKYKSKDR